MNAIAPADPFTPWFRSLPKPMQWLIGLPILAACVAAGYDHVTYVPKPGEPVKAFWVQLILLVASVVITELIRPKPNIEDARPAGLGDFQVPTATEGRPVPIIFGRVRQKGPNVVWYGDLVQEAISEYVKTGLWSGQRVTKGFRYQIGVQFVICRGGGSNVTLRKVWIGDNEVFSGTVSTDTTFDIDKPELFGGDDLGQGGVQATCDFYTGSNTQTSNPYLDDPARQQIAVGGGTSTCPAYRGNCYVVARQLTSAAPSADDIGAYFGNSTTLQPWSFEVERFPSLFGAQGGSQNKVGSDGDCNPVNAIYELLTNDEWGFGESASQIDASGTGSSFYKAAQTMINEGNGMSLLLDRQLSAKELMTELQRQIDGVVFINPTTGKWQIQLAREAGHSNFGYTIGSVPQLTDDNVVEVRDYTRGAWEDTTNTVTVKFDKRDDDYKESYALAQDMANAMIRGDGTVSGAQAVSASVTYPGVKNSALAAQLAWRDLRAQSFPLARCTLVTNRESYDVVMGSVIAWTNTALGYTQLPMRVTAIDYGRLEDNTMKLTVVQDVFSFVTASFAAPGATQWTQPSLAAQDFSDAVAISAPRALIVRDPDYNGDETAGKVFVSAAVEGTEVAYDVVQRSGASNPASGTYGFTGTVASFMEVGALVADLDAGEANPKATLLIKPDASTQTAMLAAFSDGATVADLGQDLVHLILINGEFMLVTSAEANGANVQLNGVYRGALDSGQNTHAADDKVYLLFAGSAVPASSFDNSHFVDIKLLGRTYSNTLAEGSATEREIDLNERPIRPYPPAAIYVNSSGTAYTTPDLEDNGTGENGQQFAVDWDRRAYNNADEVAALVGDADPNVGGASSTEYRVRVFVDPTGSNDEIASSPFAWTSGTGTIQIPRNEILDEAAAGTEIRIQIDARHTYDSVVYTSQNVTQFDVTPTTVNDGLFYLGGNIQTGPSNAYTVADAGVHTIDVGANPSAGSAEYRINGGSWLTVTAGGTTTASLSVSDTIEVRHTNSGVTPDPNFVWIENPSAVRVAYGCL